MLQEKLKERDLPPLPVVSSEEEWEDVRKNLLCQFCREEYGLPLPEAQSVTVQVITENTNCLAGKAHFYKLRLTTRVQGQDFSFPVEAVVPYRPEPVPAFVCISFFEHVPNFSLPAEDVVDAGFAAFSFHYTDITTDDGDFSTGLAGLLGERDRKEKAPGKLMMWAWAAQRVMDALQNFPGIDPSQVAVVGHSRLGKAALLAGTLDTRFTLVIANESGCSGAALSRGKIGEDIRAITKTFPFWFCPAYGTYAGREEELPFDQHALLALCAPRYAYVCSAQEDLWADPTSEFLSCVAASPAWEALGKPGFSAPDRLPEVGDAFGDGSIGYHLRAGAHGLLREDWLHFLAFFRHHLT